ncbi:NAD(P) transhydrogenase subunit alpha [Verrucomicrobia bacterium SCGC AG-212-E04]|nr:NAD(P) transhydrogenase subunit alpha [Verrucomicrobia bacterium SCGC AG-212-E04]
MRIFIPREMSDGESRVPLIPATVAKLIKLGAAVEIESGLGVTIHRSDADYAATGAIVNTSRAGGLAAADMVLRLQKPPLAEVATMRRGVIHISYLDPFKEHELVSSLAAGGVSAISKEMIPRSTIAQKMDALSSQANLAGYSAVILAAERLNRIFPMMTTPAGTMRPVKVLVIGVGVAGLQAIATAKRLGAQVEAFDTRPVVEEQVKSLGAKFVKIDLGETGQTAQGYAKELTPEQLAKQREVMAERVAASEVVITTAQVFGRPAPRIVTTEMVKRMSPGSVVVDLAVESGGNVECSRLGEEVDVNGVLVIGVANMPGRVAAAASEMYSNNIGNFVEHFWDADTKAFRLDREHEILKGCLITHGGEIVHATIRDLIELRAKENGNPGGAGS